LLKKKREERENQGHFISTIDGKREGKGVPIISPGIRGTTLFCWEGKKKKLFTNGEEPKKEGQKVRVRSYEKRKNQKKDLILTKPSGAGGGGKKAGQYPLPILLEKRGGGEALDLQSRHGIWGGEGRGSKIVCRKRRLGREGGPLLPRNCQKGKGGGGLVPFVWQEKGKKAIGVWYNIT